jgi:hypothetical protein
MINSLDVLQIAIGLSFVYLLLSLICSAVSEGLETLLKNRSRDMERGLRELLNDEDGVTLVQQIYNHPLISGLFRDKYEAERIGKRLFFQGKSYLGRTLPSYIPSRHFALALMDIILPASATAPGGSQGALNSGRTAAPLATVEALRAAAAAFPNPAVSRALLVMIDASGNDMGRIRQSLEHWFDHSMDRVAGWYKRRTQVMIFAIAIASSSMLNLDTINIATRLATDSAMSSSLAATAEEYAKQQRLQFTDLKQSIDSLSLGIPIGWDAAPANYYNWLLKILGLLASALAATLGAPFWFDLLNRFITLRSTIKPKDKSGDDANTR